LELYGLGLDYLQRYPDMIRAITREEIQAVAREFLSAEKYVLAIAGPE
jgi:zinc protease